MCVDRVTRFRSSLGFVNGTVIISLRCVLIELRVDKVTRFRSSLGFVNGTVIISLRFVLIELPGFSFCFQLMGNHGLFF